MPKVVASTSHSSLPKDMASLSLTDDKSHKARLLLSKTKVASLNGMTVPRTEMKGLIIATKLMDLSLASMRDLPSSVTFCLDSECTISAVDSDNGLLKPYFTNKRAVVKGKFQEWQQKYPEIDFEPLRHIAGNVNPADLHTRTNCTTKDVEKDTPWQKGPSFLKLPRDQWPVLKDFKMKIPEDKINKTTHEPVIQICHLKLKVSLV